MDNAWDDGYYYKPRWQRRRRHYYEDDDKDSWALYLLMLVLKAVQLTAAVFLLTFALGGLFVAIDCPEGGVRCDDPPAWRAAPGWTDMALLALVALCAVMDCAAAHHQSPLRRLLGAPGPPRPAKAEPVTIMRWPSARELWLRLQGLGDQALRWAMPRVWCARRRRARSPPPRRTPPAPH